MQSSTGLIRVKLRLGDGKRTSSSNYIKCCQMKPPIYCIFILYNSRRGSIVSACSFSRIVSSWWNKDAGCCALFTQGTLGKWENFIMNNPKEDERTKSWVDLGFLLKNLFFFFKWCIIVLKSFAFMNKVRFILDYIGLSAQPILLFYITI